MKTVIFANGTYSPNLYATMAIRQAECLIAADNGARYCLDHGILPDVLIGDLDSLSPALLKEILLAETDIIQYPEEKNMSDFELALEYAVTHQATDITILGGLGGRWDMSLSNIFLLTAPELAHIKMVFIMEDHFLHVVHANQRLCLNGQAGDLVSLLPLTPLALGITTEQLRYPLYEEHLSFASSRGVSNRLTHKNGSVSLSAGVLLCAHYF